MEHKQTEATITAVDEAQGIVEAIWAVMGNTDEVGDIIHPGAFTKTFSERGHQIKLLDNHRTDSVMSALGTVIELRELRRGELPQEILSNPDVTGGAWGKFQFLMDTPEGAGAFKRIKSKAIQSWSFGYDAVDKDYTRKDGQTIRNLRQIKLYEVSPVLFPANPITTTTSAKAAPAEGKPWRAVREGQVWNVYKLDEDGKPTGKPIGSHDSEEEADAQIRALYANEEGTDKAAPEPQEEKAGRMLNARNAQRIMAAFEALHQCLMDAGLMDMPEEETDKPAGPQKSDNPPTLDATGAGPNEDGSTRLIQLIELELENLEV